jgi:hypothetical protein
MTRALISHAPLGETSLPDIDMTTSLGALHVRS